MVVRRITNRGGRKQVGKFASLKNGQIVMWESLLERDFMYWLEFDRNVISYEGQPLKARFVLGGEPHHYTPDFLAIRKNRKQIFEVKYEADAAKEENQIKFHAISHICRENGYEFKVVTEKTIRVEPKLDNIKFLFRFASVQPEIQDLIAVRRYFDAHSEANLGDLLSLFRQQDKQAQLVYALLYRGVLKFDLTEPITSASTVVYAGI